MLKGRDGMNIPRWVAISIIVTILSGGGVLNAAEGDGSGEQSQGSKGAQSPKTLEERLNELEQKQQISDRLRELFQEREEQQAKERPVVGADQYGFFLRSRDRDFELRIRGYIQFDSRWYIADHNPSTTNTFDIRRARPVFQGTVYRYFDTISCRFGQGQPYCSMPMGIQLLG
jgi:hypothetical protein